MEGLTRIHREICCVWKYWLIPTNGYMIELAVWLAIRNEDCNPILKKSSTSNFM